MIYFDNAATAPFDEEAVSFARQKESECFYNPSALYGGGVSAKKLVEEAREKLLSLIGDESFELVFTSGGTEADNLAVFSARRGNAVSNRGEHAAVFESFSELSRRGIETRFAPLDPYGYVDIEKLLSLVDEKTSLVSIAHVNNETGAINDVGKIAKLVKEKNPRCLFMSDGVQAFGKIPFRLPKEIDLYSLSAHKLGGLKGVGGLVKRKTLSISPLLFGGGQERGQRSGTENVGGILAFSYAAEKKVRSIQEDFERISSLRELLWKKIQNDFLRISKEESSPYLLTISAVGLRGEVLQRLLEERGLIVGTGSACSSKKPFSRVIEACGYPKEVLHGVLRLSFSRDTTKEEILFAADTLRLCVKEFRERTGIWNK